MSTQLNKLKALLRELFQLDQADLDFGIYRIMAIKRDEITRFLEQDLLPQVRSAFDQFRPADRALAEQRLDYAVNQAQALGIDPDQTPKVKELRQKLNQAVDVTGLEAQVYDHLYAFFRRYYKDGDFISQRRYKAGVYAVPYEGEEVKLYWANHDQYYIKSAETLTSYAFKTSDGRRVHFELAAASTERDNVKPAAGQERRFLLHEDAPMEEDADGLLVSFVYQPDSHGRKQADLNVLTAQGILAAAPAAWQGALAERAPTEANPQRTLLDRHIAVYTARNTFDYFIHKDLGGFLRRELDFYVKNEVLHLDDIDQADMTQVEQSLSLVKSLRQIGHKLIDFLASIEDFQKRLWLKKKFVLEANYCITLDRVPDEFFPEIASNDAQREEWVRLFAIDQIKPELSKPGYSLPLTVDFLEANPFLVLDTTHYNAQFTERLLAQLARVDEQTSGLLVNSENLQAICLLSPLLKGKVKAVYLDPPFNTSEETFVYKNEYRHGSWLSMMSDRVRMISSCLSPEGMTLVAIDDEELYHLKNMLDQTLGADRYIGTIALQSNPRGRGINSYFATSHEYVLSYAADPKQAVIVDQLLTEEQALQYRHGEGTEAFRSLPFRRSGGLSTPDERPNSEFSIWYAPQIGAVVAVGGVRRDPYPSIYHESTLFLDTSGEVEELDFEDGLARLPDGVVRILPVDTEGRRRVWRWSDREKIMKAALRGDFEVRQVGQSWSVTLKDFIKEGRKPKTIWVDSKYDASSHGTNLLRDMFGERSVFGYPKALSSTEDALHFVVGNDANALIVDLFAGSATTGHATIELNRKDEGARRFVLVEMGPYFDRVTKARVVKSAYSRTWQAGTPVRDEPASILLKSIRLESYEDTLDNLTFQRSSAQQSLLDAQSTAREDYLLHYLLEMDTRGSASLLDVQSFANPFDYRLKVTRNYEQREVVVDLVETFNYLIGLRVGHMAVRLHRTADFEYDKHGRLVVKDGRTRSCQPGEGWTFRTVQGRSPTGDKVLVVWRTLSGDAEKDNAMLDLLFEKMDIRPRDQEFDLIYVNGDNNLENLRRPDETWKLRLIEEDFHRLMWDVEDV